MSKIIGFAGKGGTGKSTVASLVIRWLIDNKKSASTLAIDADPNATLANKLGLDQNKGVVQIVDEFSRGNQDIPAGMTKDRFFEYKIQEILNEANGFDLLSMGKPEGPGCYCYINNVLRSLIEKLTKAYQYTVIDNEAGMEHLSRRTARSIDILLIVSDETPIGISSAKRIYDLIKELGISVGKPYLIVNRARTHAETIRNEINSLGVEFAGIIPEDDELYNLNVKGRPISELSESSLAKKAIEGICKTLINGG